MPKLFCRDCNIVFQSGKEANEHSMNGGSIHRLEWREQ